MTNYARIIELNPMTNEPKKSEPNLYLHFTDVHARRRSPDTKPKYPTRIRKRPVFFMIKIKVNTDEQPCRRKTPNKKTFLSCTENKRRNDKA